MHLLKASKRKRQKACVSNRRTNTSVCKIPPTMNNKSVMEKSCAACFDINILNFFINRKEKSWSHDYYREKIIFCIQGDVTGNKFVHLLENLWVWSETQDVQVDGSLPCIPQLWVAVRSLLTYNFQGSIIYFFSPSVWLICIDPL